MDESSLQLKDSSYLPSLIEKTAIFDIRNNNDDINNIDMNSSNSHTYIDADLGELEEYDAVDVLETRTTTSLIMNENNIHSYSINTHSMTTNIINDEKLLNNNNQEDIPPQIINTNIYNTSLQLSSSHNYPSILREDDLSYESISMMNNSPREQDNESMTINPIYNSYQTSTVQYIPSSISTSNLQISTQESSIQTDVSICPADHHLHISVTQSSTDKCRCTNKDIQQNSFTVDQQTPFPNTAKSYHNQQQLSSPDLTPIKVMSTDIKPNLQIYPTDSIYKSNVIIHDKTSIELNTNSYIINSNNNGEETKKGNNNISRKLSYPNHDNELPFFPLHKLSRHPNNSTPKLARYHVTADNIFAEKVKHPFSSSPIGRLMGSPTSDGKNSTFWKQKLTAGYMTSIIGAPRNTTLL